MKRARAFALVLAAMCFCPSLLAQTPAPSAKAAMPVRPSVTAPAKTVPAWIWPIVGALGVAWFWVLFGDKGARKDPPAAEASPGATTRPSAPLGTAAAPAFPAVKAPSAPPLPTQPHSAWNAEFVAGLSLNKLETLVQRFWHARGCEVLRARGAHGEVEFLISRPGSGKLFALAQCAPARGSQLDIAWVKAAMNSGTQKTAGVVLVYSLPGFTDGALEFAQGKPLKLISAAVLLAEIRLLPPPQQQRLLEQTLILSGPSLARV